MGEDAEDDRKPAAKSPGKAAETQDRAARLQAQLRANLQRRKRQAERRRQDQGELGPAAPKGRDTP